MDEQLSAVLEMALALTRALAVAVMFSPLERPLSLTFQRNDNNIWATAVPDLVTVVGSWLRGTLGSTFSNEQTAVTLEPLAGSQPGWRPRFESPEAAKSTWPVNELKGDFLLSVTEVGAPGHA